MIWSGSFEYPHVLIEKYKKKKKIFKYALLSGCLYMYVISYGGTSSHNMQLTEFGIPTSINIGRYAPDTIILEIRSEVTVTVI